MPKLDKPLTETRVNALKFPKDYKSNSIIFWDSAGMKGFGVRMMKSGVKSYAVYLKMFSTTPFTIGDCNIFTLGEAKEQAKVMLLNAEQGIHPNAKAETKITLLELSAGYLEHRKHDRLSPITSGTLKNHGYSHKNLEKHSVGKMEADSIATVDVRKYLNTFSSVEKYRVANEMKQYLDMVFKWGMQEGKIEERFPPTALIKKIAYKPKQPRYKADEPAKIIHYLEDIKLDNIKDGQGRRIDKMWVAFTYAVLLSGARPSEIVSARFDEIDENLQALIKRDHKTKKTKEEKPIYLVDKAWDELLHYIEYERPGRLAMLGLASSPFVFPSNSEKGHVEGWAKFDRQMRKALAIEAPIYATRRNFSKIGKRTFSGDNARVANVTGHESPEMIDRYAGEDEILIQEERQQAAKDNKLIAQHIIQASMDALNERGR
jgi:integrase